MGDRASFKDSIFSPKGLAIASGASSSFNFPNRNPTSNNNKGKFSHTGTPYARPQILDQDRKRTVTKTIFMRAKRERSPDESLDDGNSFHESLNLTTTAQKIIDAISKESTPVIAGKKERIIEPTFKKFKPNFGNGSNGPTTSIMNSSNFFNDNRFISPSAKGPPNRLMFSVPRLEQPLVEKIEFEVPKIPTIQIPTRPKTADSTANNIDLNFKGPDIKFSDPWSIKDLKEMSEFHNKNLKRKYVNFQEDKNNFEIPTFKLTPTPITTGQRNSSSNSFTSSLPSTTLPPLKAEIKKDTWECPTCMIRNDNDAESCVSCSEPNPKMAKKSTSNQSPHKLKFEPINLSPPKYSFGFKNNTSSSITGNNKIESTIKSNISPISEDKVNNNIKTGFFSNNMSAVTAKPVISNSSLNSNQNSSMFSFGQSNSIQNKPTTSPPAFQFNSPSTSLSRPTPSPITTTGQGNSSLNSFTSPLPSTTLPLKIEKKNDTWECPTCMIRNNNDADQCVCCSEDNPNKHKTATTTTVKQSPPKNKLKFDPITLSPPKYTFGFTNNTSSSITDNNKIESTIKPNISPISFPKINENENKVNNDIKPGFFSNNMPVATAKPIISNSSLTSNQNSSTFSFGQSNSIQNKPNTAPPAFQFNSPSTSLSSSSPSPPIFSFGTTPVTSAGQPAAVTPNLFAFTVPKSQDQNDTSSPAKAAKMPNLGMNQNSTFTFGQISSTPNPISQQPPAAAAPALSLPSTFNFAGQSLTGGQQPPSLFTFSSEPQNGPPSAGGRKIRTAKRRIR